jgi:hypothetical protein
MGFSPLANMSRRIPDVGRSAARNANVTGFTIHHNAGVDAYGQATAAGREVSANYWITNDGQILPNVDESRRAFTSGAAGYPAGAAADHRNITVEVSNSPEGVRSGSWAISDAALDALVRLIADVWKRYNLGPVTRGASRGLGVHRDWVPTACPGPYIMGKLDEIVARANKLNEKQVNVSDDGETMQSVVVDGAHHYGVSNEFITHYASLDQSNVTRAVMSVTDELHKLSVAQFGNLLDGLGIPRDVVQAGKVLNPQTGQFERNGTWSRNREVLAALAKLAPASSASAS